MTSKFELYKIYSSLSVVKKSVVWYTMATILQKGIAFLITPILTRILSDAQYGLYSIYQSWLQIVSVISVVALDRCVTVGFMKYDNDRLGFLSSIQLLMTFTTTIFLLVILVFHSFFSRVLGMPLLLIIVMLVTALLNNTLSNWAWYQRYLYRYKILVMYISVSTVTIQAVSILAVILLPFQNKDEILILSTSLMTLLLYGFIYCTVFLKGKVGLNKKYWSFALPYSLAIVPHALAQIFLNVSDRIMIDKLCGREEVAYYGVTYSAAMVLNVVILSANSAIQPWYFCRIKAKNFRAIKEKTNQFLLLPATLSIFASLFAPELLSVLAPPSYQAALWIFPSIAAAVFFNSMYLCFANFESYYEKPIYFSIATVTGAIANVVLNFIFIPRFGFIAAGYTTLVSYMMFAVMHYVFMRKICIDKLEGIHAFDTKFIVNLSIVVTIFSTALTALYGYSMLRYCIVGFCIVGCAVKKDFIKVWVKSFLDRK